jgi:CheY-like chemotaxis protein
MPADKKKTILIVEDDPDVLSMLIKHLRFEGYNIVSADNGMEGLKLLELRNYDLVITDIVMPYVSGVGVITALKERHPHIPVIAITGFGKEPEEAALEKQANAVLAKPVKMAVLKDLLLELLPS